MRWFIAAVALAAFGCAEADEGDECVPEECTSPPPSICEERSGAAPPTVLITYAEQGICVEDRCAFAAMRSSCPDECVEERGPDGEVVDAQCSLRPPG